MKISSGAGGLSKPANGIPEWDVRFAKGGLAYEPFPKRKKDRLLKLST